MRRYCRAGTAREVAGGVVILRSGKNARDVITAVRDKLETLKAGTGRR
jgi:Cu/Ag efflux pump CusA